MKYPVFYAELVIILAVSNHRRQQVLNKPGEVSIYRNVALVISHCHLSKKPKTKLSYNLITLNCEYCSLPINLVDKTISHRSLKN